MESDSNGPVSLLINCAILLNGWFSAEIFLLFGVVAILLLFSGFISGSEVAFFSLGPKEIDGMLETNDRASKRILNLIGKPRYLLSTILVSNNLINVVIVILSYSIVTQLFSFDTTSMMGKVYEVSINIVLVTSMLILFGEIMPKLYANQNNMKIARMMVNPLLILRRVFYPISFILVKSSSFVEKRFEVNQQNNDIDYDELSKAIELTADEHTSEEDINMLTGILHFGKTNVKQIMKPRTEMFAIEVETDFTSLMKEVKSNGYSRIPIYKEDIDTIEGVLYVKDLLRYLDEEKDFEWQTLIRKAFFVPESKKIDDLLKEIQENATHLAIVVDEYGGVVGLVTLEDIVEEVVGEINDEFDEPEDLGYRKLSNNSYMFEGKVSIQDVCKAIEVNTDCFDDIKGDSDSIAGLVLELAGNFPKKNDVFEHNEFTFKVVKIGENRIEKIKLTIEEVKKEDEE